MSENIKYLAKSRLFVVANLLGGALILVTVLGAALIFAFEHVFKSLGLSADSNYAVALKSVFGSSLLILLVFILAAKISRAKLPDIVAARGVKPSLLIASVLFCCLAMALGNIASNIVVSFFPQVDNPALYESTPAPADINQLVLQILYIAAIPALVEEFAIRGVALGLLRPFGNSFAVIATAVVFSLMHGNFVQIPFALVIGIAFGIVTVLSGSIWPAIAAHFVNNALSVVISYFSPQLSGTQRSILTLSLYAVWIILGILGIGLMFTNGVRKNLANNPKRGNALSLGTRFCNLYLAPAFIAACLIYIVIAVLWIK